MTDLCLDTSAYSALKRGDDEVYIYLERADRILVPTVVLGELRAGFADGGRRTQSLLELSEFLSLPGCEIAMIDEAVSRRYRHRAPYQRYTYTDERHMDCRGCSKHSEYGSYQGSPLLSSADTTDSSLMDEARYETTTTFKPSTV